MDKRVPLAAPRATARVWRERSRSSNAHSSYTDPGVRKATARVLVSEHAPTIVQER